MNTDKWERFIRDTEKFILDGNYGRAKELLSDALAKGRIPRRRASEIAPLLCRAGMGQEAVVLLSRYVKSSSKTPANPTPKEIVEFAFAIIFAPPGQTVLFMSVNLATALTDPESKY